MEVHRKLNFGKHFFTLLSTLTNFHSLYCVTSLMKRSIKMQHLVDDKKMRENETNVIKCSAQLFQGPIDNADFLVNIIHPTDRYEKIVPQTIINYSKGHIIPIQSVEECRKNDEYSTSKGEDIVK